MVGNLGAIKDFATDYILNKEEYIEFNTLANNLLVSATKEYIDENFLDKTEMAQIFSAVSEEQLLEVVKEYMQKNYLDKTTMQRIIKKKKGDNT